MRKFKKYALPLLTIAAFAILQARCSVTKRSRPLTSQEWTLQLSEKSSLSMSWIPPGTFMMGSEPAETGRKTDESPRTEVTLTKGYWMGQTELTVGQWKAVTGETLREHVIKMLNDNTVYDFGGQQKMLRDFMGFKQNDPDNIMANEDESLPMYFVSWNDAMAFCKLLNTKEKAAGRLPVGYEYSLPTEAQWEFACRAGTTYETFAGPMVITGRTAAILDGIAWYGSNSAVNYEGKKLTTAGPRNAGEKKPNAWGMYDMLGNLWEWCLDWYGPYPGGKVTDPVGPATGKARVDRGGSWGSGPADERSANRAQNPQPEKSAWRGFRIALCPLRPNYVN